MRCVHGAGGLRRSRGSANGCVGRGSALTRPVSDPRSWTLTRYRSPAGTGGQSGAASPEGSDSAPVARTTMPYGILDYPPGFSPVIFTMSLGSRSRDHTAERAARRLLVSGGPPG